MTGFVHQSILLEEIVDLLEPKPGGLYIDATLGGGGHAAGILARGGPDARLIGFDRDLDALAAAKGRLAEFGDRITFVHGTFGGLEDRLRELGSERVDGLVADLGVSSPQLDRAERGFSFASAGPLDMRMDASQGETALQLIERLDAEALADILYRFGEERRSRAIARSILRARDEGALETTDDLRRAVVRVLGPKRGKIDPATRTFQALRIAVNAELEELEALLAALPSILREGGIAAILSFHSLEDRLVKHAFRDAPLLEPLFRKPRLAGEAERAENPRARSAKLRAARRIPEAPELERALSDAAAWRDAP